MTPDLAELRRLAEAATPGPWAARYGVSWEARVCATTGSLADVDSTANAELIAAAVNALPGLLDAAAERDALAADADKWQRAALTLQRDRDALTDERDSLSWQAEAIRADELRRHEAGLDADLAYQAFAGEEALR